MEGSGKRRGRTFKVIPLPSEIERSTINERSQWKEVGKNHQIRRMFISGGVSMFAETMRPCLEKHHGRVLSSFSEVVNKSIPFWDKLAEIDREGWAARARVEKKTDHYIYIRKAREKGCSEREVLSVQLSDCESDPDELPGQICNIQSVDRHMFCQQEASERTDPVSCLSTSRVASTLTEEVSVRQDSQQSREENIVRARMTASTHPSHRTEMLYNRTSADRNVRFDKEAMWRGRTSISNETTRRYNRCINGFRDAALIQDSQW
ncbi:hypothetical protein DICVIV_06379 [Dictyocaulus viviparus]|uniref:Uncharacterized protein n=1 Tax=Dictyocaulus viviparus TaxID=29172 RepID=A0A0D8XSB3_DICVI|nr:hypothetical protein DICVIV_06379 [Dictyocaulus viviparus]